MKNVLVGSILLTILWISGVMAQGINPIPLVAGKTHINTNSETEFIWTRTMMDSLKVKMIKAKFYKEDRLLLIEKVGSLERTIVADSMIISGYKNLASLKDSLIIEYKGISMDYKELADIKSGGIFSSNRFNFILGVVLMYAATEAAGNIK